MTSKRRAISLLLCAVCGIMLFGQSPNIVWQRTYGGSEDDVARSIQRTSDGGHLVAGFTYSNDGDVQGQHGYRDLWVFKLDSSGAIQWQRTMGNASWNEAEHVLGTADGGCILVGTTADGVQFDHWLVKLDSLGQTEWERVYGGSGTDIGWSVALASDGGFISVGSTDSQDGDVIGNHGQTDLWVARTDAAGNPLWQRCYGGTGAEYHGSIEQTPEGGYVVLAVSNSTDGDLTSNQGSGDLWVVKLDIEGDIEWQRSFGGSSGEYPANIICTADGGFMMVGFSDSSDGDLTSNQGSNDAWLVKLDSGGELQWQRSYGGANNDVAADVVQMVDGGYLFVGSTMSDEGFSFGNHGLSDFWVVRTDASGDVLWHRCIGGSDRDGGFSIAPHPDGHVMLTGYAQSPDGDVLDLLGVRDVWMIELGAEDLTTDIPRSSPEPFVLAPNPTDGLVRFAPYRSGSTGLIHVYNAMGQLSLEIAPQAGPFELDLSVLPSGVYHVTEYRTNLVSTTRVILR